MGASFGKWPSLPATTVLILKREILYFRVSHFVDIALKYIQDITTREYPPFFYQAEKRLRTLYCINGQQYQLLRVFSGR